MAILIADSGSTKCEWCLVTARGKKTFITQGMSPYFLNADQMEQVIRTELLPGLKKSLPQSIYFYGTGHKNPDNVARTKRVFQKLFPAADVHVTHDLMAAARSLCQHEPGIACILGTGSNSCSFNGKKITKNSPGLGYVLGDEGSGAYLGKKVIQHYLYDIFDGELKKKFEKKYKINDAEILENVYRKPLPNRYLATYAMFLGENRGHFMVENILEDGINDFFYHHVSRYKGVDKLPVHFTGSVAFYFRDVVQSLCEAYGMKTGIIHKNPMEGLIKYHRSEKLK